VAARLGLDGALAGSAGAQGFGTPEITNAFDGTDVATANGRPFHYDLCIEVTKDNRARFEVPRQEVGQGVITTAAMILVLALLVVGSGCGSRLPHERLLADWRGGTTARDAGASAPGMVSGAHGVVADQSGTGGVSEGLRTAATASATAPVRRAAGATPGDGDNGASATGGRPPSSGGTEASQVSAERGPVSAGRGPAPVACSGKEAPIVAGTVGLYSGALGGLVREIAGGVQAWIAARNAEGGIGCHRIRYLIADDGGDPSRHQSLVRKLVEDDHVVAFVQMAALLTGGTTVDYLTKKRIPVIGSDSAGDWFYQSPMYFPQAPHGIYHWQSGVYGAGDVARVTGRSKIGILYCAEVAQCTDIAKQAEEQAPPAGMKLVYKGQISLAQPSYLSECQAAQNAGVEILLPTGDPATISRIARSCASVNYHPQYVVYFSNVNPDVTSDRNLDGLVVINVVAPWLATNPAVKEYQDTMRRHAPGLAVNSRTIFGWATAKLFGRALAHGVPEPPTSEAILEGLWSIKNEDFGGLTMPITFNREQNATPTRCWWLVQARGGQWTALNDGGRRCA